MDSRMRSSAFLTAVMSDLFGDGDWSPGCLDLGVDAAGDVVGQLRLGQRSKCGCEGLRVDLVELGTGSLGGSCGGLDLGSELHALLVERLRELLLEDLLVRGGHRLEDRRVDDQVVRDHQVARVAVVCLLY